MKGVLDFLEKAGLVTKDTPAQQATSQADVALATEQTIEATDTVPCDRPGDAQGTELAQSDPATPLQLDAIYAREGVPIAAYPAERLLRLIDGLSAMDPATRLMAIRAMDAADESWTIADPLADAQAKAQALARHSERQQIALQQREHEVTTQLAAVGTHRDKVVGDVRKQIAELEALMDREQNRAAAEIAAREASLLAARTQSRRELSAVALVRDQLLGLALQFGGAAATPQE